MAPPFKLGQLIDTALPVKAQARFLRELQKGIKAEQEKQAVKAKAGRERRAQPAYVAQRTARQRTSRLRTILHTSTNPEQLRAARQELDAASFNEQPTTQQAVSTMRRAAIIQHHSPGVAGYWAHLGAAPDCAPGDTLTAMVFFRKVLAVLEMEGWTHSERACLYDLAKKWGPRARGEDARFMVVGTQPGRLPRALEQKIQLMKERSR